jgi:tetratricopeptide (TPR) repeat protein
MVGVVASIVVLTAATLTMAPATASAAAPAPSANSEEALRHYAQGRLLEERGESEEALGEYYRALLLEPREVAVARRVSELSARLGETARSMEFADRVLSIDPGDPRGLWLKGTALFNSGKAAESLPFLERAVAGDSSDAEMLRTLARVAEHLDRVDLVARANQRVVELEDDDGESWFQLATARARLGDFEGAEHALDRSAEINPLRPGMLFLQGWVKEGLDQTDAAIDLYRRHLGIHGGDQVTRRRFVHLLARRKSYEEAYREVRLLAQASPNDLDVVEVEADLALHLKRSKDASVAIDRMERIAGDDPESVGRVVSVLARFDRKQRAYRVADQWAARHSGDCRGPMLIARARAQGGESARAEAELRRAIEMCPDSLAPRVLLARVQQDEKRFDEAEKVWVETVRRFPAHVGVALDLAYCREQLGDLGGAQQAARDALTHSPENPTVLNFLGYLLADHNRNLDEAQDLIGRALQKDPDNGAYVDSMGWVHYRLGRLAEARRELERAVNLTRGDPVVHEHLGDVYKDLKLLDLAKDQYQKSLAGDGANQRVRAKLMELR